MFAISLQIAAYTAVIAALILWPAGTLAYREAPLFILLVAWRAVKEERALVAELAGYEAYAQRVRYRLVPFVW